MTPLDFAKSAVRIYGRKHWKALLARDLGVDVSTIHRIGKRDQVPGPYEVALNGMVENWRQRTALEKAARKLLPRGYKKRHVAPRKPKSKPQPGSPT